MDNRNFILTVVLSLLVLVGYQYLYERPRALELQQRQQALQAAQIAQQKLQPTQTATVQPPNVVQDRQAVVDAGIAKRERVAIATDEVRGSVNLVGGRLDDLTLVKYHETPAQESRGIVLLSPTGAAAPHLPYYAETGWLSTDATVPDSRTLWQTNRETVGVEQPVTLSWNNGKGLIFERMVAVDEHFMFTITDRVRNVGTAAATVYPFALIARHGQPQTDGTYILHEGPIGVFDDKLVEHTYDDIIDGGRISSDSTGGWLGITDKYWLTALIPQQDERITTAFSHVTDGKDSNPAKGMFQSDFRGSPVIVAAGATAERTTRIFAGAKVLRTLDSYETRYNIPRFDHAIDFGWFYFLTKPFLYLLDSMGRWFGNFGLAILAFTVLLKLLTLPLSMKSYRSMARLKALQPEVKQIQERFKDDRAKAGMETMELYRREHVNPMSGCFPVLIQIPIFFALYKVLYVGIEMRHAPFYGWIHDLSGADPTSVLTLFGLIPWSIIPHLGVWPLLMGISMFLQQKLSPQPPDKMQARIFMILPVVFTFMLAQMPAGLVIYWTWSNILGVAQQWFIMRKMAVKPRVGV